MNVSADFLITAGVTFAYVGGLAFLLIGSYLSYRRGRLHPLLLLSISAISFSWIEAPYDWAVYAQFPPALPRMPSWWPLDMTWGGLPSAVPVGYIAYFVLPAVIGAALGRWVARKFQWRRPQTLLVVGFAVGFFWAFVFNALIGARLGLFYYGYVIPGLGLWEGTKNQYPIYDSIAMGVQMMTFTYLLGRTDAGGRNVLDMLADKFSKTRLQSALISVVAVILVGHAVYASVFMPHLVTKLNGWVTSGPTEQLFPGVPNQPQ
ncbi:spirocyclase AveC family protein [[Mycobacterium] burgundiense]|uniref:Spirocyclase AveC family protein n=1 Tax=[Mycobacterium] burgundiense TaxID=3064286 RepID=A0ABN9NR48_9MYCO|nr:spirocyclase AveC family protein [Mycolicibacterium sp. MU0053]CAJ1510608.1 spirocyclase AveC family protein [Mycolicibacterium sp. MU0053]